MSKPSVQSSETTQSASRKSPLRRAVNLTVGFAFAAWLVWFVSTHWQDVLQAGSLSPREWGVVLPAVLADFLLLSALQCVLLRSQGVQIGFGTLTLLTTGGRLLNYTPFRFGSILKARYLKQHAELPYTAFVVVMFAQPILAILVASLCGVIPLFMGRLSAELQPMAVAGLLLSICLLGVARLPWLADTDRLRPAILGVLIDSWRRVAKDGSVLLKSLALIGLRIAAQAARFGILLSAMQLDVHWTDLLLISGAGEIGMLGPFTPNGLGQREAIIGVMAIGLGLPSGSVVAAAAVDRCVMMVGTLVVGLLPAIWLWRSTMQRMLAPTDAEIAKNEIPDCASIS